MRPQHPRYDAALVAGLVRESRVFATKRVVAWLSNHDYEAAALIVRVLVHLEFGAVWLGSCTLANAETADEYLVTIDGVEWYLKLYVNADQSTVVVWSCWWQGSVH